MNNKEFLKDLYTEREMKKQAISYFIKKHHPILYSDIMSIEINSGFLVKAYCFINNIFTNPLCYCGKETSFVSMTSGFSKTCSYKCMGKVDETKLKRKATTQEKYGVDNISLVTREQAGTTIKNKSPELKEQFVRKMRETSLERFGVTNVNKSTSIREKTKQTNLERYGVEYPTQSKKIIMTMQENNLKKYGVISVSQLSEVHNKKFKFRFKEYVWKTGEISKVQGHEPIVLKELEAQGYTFNDIKTSPKEMPIIMYKLNGKDKRYFPDIFIPKDNIIIEVKSNYTILCNLEMNKEKFDAVRNLGYDFRVEIR